MADKLTTNNNVRSSDDAEECSTQADTEIDRQIPRTDFRGCASAVIYPRDGGTSQPVRCMVQMRDLSHSGFGITHTQMLLQRQRVELELGTKCLVGEVQWCRPIQSGLYIAGCRLITSE
jgi:hypothetical protein